MNNINRVIDELFSFIKTLPKPSIIQANELRGTMFFSDNHEEVVVIRGEEEEKYNKIRDRFFEYGDDIKASRNFIQHTITKAIHYALFGDTASVSSTFSDRIKKSKIDLKGSLTKKPFEWNIYYELSGLSSIKEDIQIGNVKFHSFTRDDTNDIYNIISNEDGISEAESYLQEFIQDFGVRFEGNTVAIVFVDAIDEKYAKHMADNDLRKIVDIINFYSDIIYNRKMAYVSMIGEGENATATNILIRLGEDKNVILQTNAVGKQHMFDLGVLVSNQSNSFQFAKVNQILMKKDRSELENKIINVMQWSGRASVDQRLEEGFLLNAIALEALLIGKSLQDINYRLSIRTSLLIGESLSSKKIIFNNIKKLYDIRSKIVHQGITNVSEDDFRALWVYIKTSIIKILSDPILSQFQKVDELEAWFEEQLLQ